MSILSVARSAVHLAHPQPVRAKRAPQFGATTPTVRIGLVDSPIILKQKCLEIVDRLNQMQISGIDWISDRAVFHLTSPTKEETVTLTFHYNDRKEQDAHGTVTNASIEYKDMTNKLTVIMARDWQGDQISCGEIKVKGQDLPETLTTFLATLRTDSALKEYLALAVNQQAQKAVGYIDQAKATIQRLQGELAQATDYRQVVQLFQRLKDEPIANAVMTKHHQGGGSTLDRMTEFFANCERKRQGIDLKL